MCGSDTIIVEGFRRKKTVVPPGLPLDCFRLQSPISTPSWVSSLPAYPTDFILVSLYSCMRKSIKINLSPSIHTHTHTHTSYWFYLYKSLPLAQREIPDWEAESLLLEAKTTEDSPSPQAKSAGASRHGKCQGPGWTGFCGSHNLDMRPERSKAWNSLEVHLKSERPVWVRKRRQCYNCGITNKKASCKPDQKKKISVL